MTHDFYLDEFAAAAYFEKDWFDQVILSGGARPGRFAFAPFDLGELHSPFHQNLAGLIAGAQEGFADPARMLEIGAGTGRLFYELTRRLEHLGEATLVEPSLNLRGLFEKIFVGDGTAAESAYFRVLKGNGELAEVRLNTAAIRERVGHVRRRCLNVPFAELPADLGTFDLVVCADVIDQCHYPLALVELLKRSTAPGGLVALSCTYQWQAKYRGLPPDPVRHLDQFFEDGWTPAGEANLPFRVRVNERHWMTFLSHVGLYRRG